MSLDLIVRVTALEPGDLEPAPPVQTLLPVVQAATLSADEDPGGWFDEVAPAPPLMLEVDDEEAEERRLAAFARKYHSPDARMNVTLRARSVLLEVLRLAKAVFDAPLQDHRGPCEDGDGGSRGPDGEVPTYKFLSNDGWHVTREECHVLHDRLRQALEEGLVVEVGGLRFELRPDAPDKDDREALRWLHEVAGFFATAARHHGFEVW